MNALMGELEEFLGWFRNDGFIVYSVKLRMHQLYSTQFKRLQKLQLKNRERKLLKAEEDSRLEEVLAAEAREREIQKGRKATKRIEKRVPLDLEHINAERRSESSSGTSEDSESDDGQGCDKKGST